MPGQRGEKQLKTRHWLLVLALSLFAVSAAATVVVVMENRAIAQARGSDDMWNTENENNQLITFMPFPGEHYVSCTPLTEPYLLNGATAAGSPSPAATPAPKLDPVPPSITLGDVIQVTVVFDCSFANTNPATINAMRNTNVQFKPDLEAIDFDIEGIMTDELAGRDFYCVRYPADAVCADGSTTPAADLKWTWFLRPKSVGRHLVRLQVYQRRIVAPGQYAEIAPRWARRYSVDVREPLSAALVPWLPFIAGAAGFIFSLPWVRARILRYKDSQSSQS